MNKKAWGLKSSKRIMNREEKEHPTTLTCYPLGHDVRHLTTGGEHPHAQLVHHQHLEAKRTVHIWKQREQFTPGSKGNSSQRGGHLLWRLPPLTASDFRKSPETQSSEQSRFPRGQKFAKIYASFYFPTKPKLLGESALTNMTWFFKLKKIKIFPMTKKIVTHKNAKEKEKNFIRSTHNQRNPYFFSA